MSPRANTLKAFFSWTFISAATLLTLFISLVCVTSLWLGVKYLPRDGSWIPIVSGALLLALSLWAYFRVTTGLYRRLKKEDMLDL